MDELIRVLEEKETLLESGSIYKVLKLVKEGYRTIAYLELLGTD